MSGEGIGARLVAQGGRPLHARARAVRRRHQAARHAGGGVPAQPAGARAHQGDPHPAGHARSRLYRRGPDRRRRHPRRHHAAGLQVLACSRCWPRARCATSASPSPCALRRRRAEAEDLAAAIELDLEPLPAVADMLAARKAGAPLVHEHWGDNLFLTTAIGRRTSRPSRPRPPFRSPASCAPRARS